MDRRNSPIPVLKELRQRVVAMKKEGHTHTAIARLLKIGESTSRKYWRLYREAGEPGLELGRRGRPAGQNRRLTSRQEKAIQKIVTDKTPDQLKMPFALWTRAAVGELIEKRYDMKLPIRTLGGYLKRWGFTPQKPKRKAYEQQPEAVRQWLDETYPTLAKRAKREKSDILWGDETGITNQDQRGRSYAPKGKTPVRRALAKKVSTSMISAIGSKGQCRFMIFKGGMNARLFISFLKRLICASKCKIHLIVDNLRAHKAKLVETWLEENAGKIELHYLPSYSPDLNPDEYLNNTLKNQLANRPPAQSIKEQQQRVRSQMKSNQRNPKLVTSLFKKEEVRYAA